MKQRLSPKWWLMVLPVVVLAGFAWFSGREPQVVRVHRTEPHRLVFDKIEMQPARDGRTSVTMLLALKGDWPQNFTNPSSKGVPGSDFPEWAVATYCDVFYKDKGKWRLYVWPRENQPIYWVSVYDSDIKRFTSPVAININAVPAKLGALECRMRTMVWRINFNKKGNQVSRSLISDVKGTARLR